MFIVSMTKTKSAEMNNNEFKLRSFILSFASLPVRHFWFVMEMIRGGGGGEKHWLM